MGRQSRGRFTTKQYFFKGIVVLGAQEVGVLSTRPSNISKRGFKLDKKVWRDINNEQEAWSDVDMC